MAGEGLGHPSAHSADASRAQLCRARSRQAWTPTRERPPIVPCIYSALIIFRALFSSVL